jgi:hypothetical protein
MQAASKDAAIYRQFAVVYDAVESLSVMVAVPGCLVLKTEIDLMGAKTSTTLSHHSSDSLQYRQVARCRIGAG